MIQNNSDPKNAIKQWMKSATPEQKQNLFMTAKQFGCPDNVLAMIQNLDNN